MIPLADITAWSNKSPWLNPHYVEQDLVLCRVLTEIYNDSVLASKLAFRGGTAIHKLYLSPQPRYSEDIDFIQINPEPVGITLNHIRDALAFLGKPAIKQKSKNNTIVYRFLSESLPQVVLRLKIEINCQEHLNIFGFNNLSFEVQNPWFTGNCDIVAYSFDELIGTKIRALYQRKKGRDLFDAFYAFKSGKLDIQTTIDCYKEYIKFSTGQVPTSTQYLENLTDKMSDPAFIIDMESLLRPGIQYDANEAYEVFRENFIEAM